MNKAKLNLFVRVYRRKLAEGMTMQEVDAEYPKLTETELDEIHAAIEGA